MFAELEVSEKWSLPNIQLNIQICLLVWYRNLTELNMSVSLLYDVTLLSIYFVTGAICNLKCHWFVKFLPLFMGDYEIKYFT